MARHPTPLTETEKERIATALAAGVPLKHLVASGRFKGVAEETMRRIANERNVQRRKHTRRSPR